jgi:hypothetical protein
MKAIPFKSYYLLQDCDAAARQRVTRYFQDSKHW